MVDALIHSFQHIDDADAARRMLVDAGVEPSSIELQVLADEAGPVEGNFLVGNGRDEAGRRSDSVRDGGTDAPHYATNFEAAVTRGAYLLVIQPDDGEQRERIASLLRDVGVDVGAVGRRQHAPDP